MQDESTRERALQKIETVYAKRSQRRATRTVRAAAVQDELAQHRWLAYGQALAATGLCPLAQRSILDVGCQWGTFLGRCREDWGQNDPGRLCGIDLMDEWVQEGLQRFDFLDLRHGSADRLPWEDASFDLVHQGMVFSSVLDSGLRAGIASEIARVLRANGTLLWYDFFFNPKNPDTIGMTLQRVRQLYPNWVIRYRRRITLAAPLARRLQRISARSVVWLTAFKILNFHHLIVLEKPGPKRNR